MPSRAQAGVYLGQRRVGTLGYHNGNTWFDYEDRDPLHPVLGQRFEADPDRRRTASGRLPEWFANLLPEPESGLRRLIGEELGQVNPHDFRVITFLGEDLPGAVRVVPESGPFDFSERIDQTSDRVDHMIRFSLAGVQPKFSMRWTGKGLVLPMSGQGGDWIVKLPDQRFPDVPRNEYTMLYWARLAGIDVPKIKLLQGTQLSGLPPGMISEGDIAFGVERFDRTGDGRIHQEDFAQVREVSPDLKYDRATYSGLGRFIQATCPEEDVEEYVRRLAAMVVMGNLDAHLKNWTIRYLDGRTARLSPAYDFVSVSAYPEFRSEQLAFAINGGRFAARVTMDNFRRFALRSNINPEFVVTTIRATVTTLVQSWPQVKSDCDIPGFVESHIEQRLGDLPLIKTVQLTSE